MRSTLRVRLNILTLLILVIQGPGRLDTPQPSGFGEQLNSRFGALGHALLPGQPVEAGSELVVLTDVLPGGLQDAEL